MGLLDITGHENLHWIENCILSKKRTAQLQISWVRDTKYDKSVGKWQDVVWRIYLWKKYLLQSFNIFANLQMKVTAPDRNTLVL